MLPRPGRKSVSARLSLLVEAYCDLAGIEHCVKRGTGFFAVVRRSTMGRLRLICLISSTALADVQVINKDAVGLLP
jgi:hypothetical protein